MRARSIASTRGKTRASSRGAQQLYIDPQECIDCGACVPVCPVSAIFAIDDLPAKWSHFAQINEEHYRKVG
jgi:NAD-dependent dihydropyrimidine dehydrogenase PreA subunit